MLDVYSGSKILWIEDDPDFRDEVEREFSKEVKCDSVGTFGEARALLSQKRYDLILLDLSLPDGEGLKFCSKIQEEETHQKTPVIILTGRNSIDDKVTAFVLGADDYLVKPIDLRELKARVFSKLRKAKKKSEEDQIYVLDGIKFILSMQKVYYFKDHQDILIDMTPIEFRLLLVLAKNEEKRLSRDELIDWVWGKQVHVVNRTVDSHISDLRKKIEVTQYMIQSVRGLGYRLVRKKVPLKFS